MFGVEAGDVLDVRPRFLSHPAYMNTATALIALEVGDSSDFGPRGRYLTAGISK
jgi:hypothetical protein